MEELRKEFEIWALKHMFLIHKDKTMDIYANAFTEGAWLAYQAGFELGKVNG